jgi:glucose-6-phosphate isomerase
MQFDFTYAMADAIGPEHGVSEAELAALQPRVDAGHAELARLRASGEVGFRDLAYPGEQVRRVKAVAASVTGRFQAVVVLGIGGSALGTIALRSALCHPLHNEMPAAVRGAPRLYVEDNVDPDRLSALFDVVEPARTLFVVISKSGATVETMSQLLLVRSLLGGDLSRNVVAITDKAEGALRPIADAECLASLDVPRGVGGRFSVLSPVGLFPAALVGLDIDELLAGARAADEERCSQPSVDANPAYKAAAIEYLLYGRGHRLSVMMPYSHALRDVADWYRQLWAESLGKSIEVGPTPIRALGVTDQHSQVQLYRDGPNDKVFCFLGVGRFSHEVPIETAWPDVESLGYIGGHTFNELIEYERIATALALTDARRPNYTITLPDVSPFTVGQLFHTLEVKTAISGQLYGVNAFDQPGVEAGKALAYGLMGRKGYEVVRRWVEDKQAGKPAPPVQELLDRLEKRRGQAPPRGKGEAT